MFFPQKIFHQFPELISYVGTRNFFMRPKQFHSQSGELQQNIDILEKEFQVQKAFFLAQCQGAEIVEVTDNNLEDIIYADACFTRLQNISLNVVVADCVPILLYDAVQQIIGVVHAGWRGSSEKILQKTLENIKNKYGSEMKNISLFIGPCISQKNYEVGGEVTQFFPQEVLLKKQNKYYLDIRAENLSQAMSCGVPMNNIEVSDECTYELPEKYFSYRREKLKANFVCGIGIKKGFLTNLKSSYNKINS